MVICETYVKRRKGENPYVNICEEKRRKQSICETYVKERKDPYVNICEEQEKIHM